MGKHKPVYDPASDVGDYVVVTNCRGVQVTGKKAEQKVYRKHTGWRLKETTFAEMMDKTPEEASPLIHSEVYRLTLARKVIRKAVSGMLPKNKLRQRRLERLKIFPGEDHPYSANILTRYDIPTKRLRASLAARTSTTPASSPVTP
jgi:large subunit ribosomal protein L13